MNKTDKTDKKLGRPPKFGARMQGRSYTLSASHIEWLRQQSRARQVSESQVIRSLIDGVMEMQGAKR